MQTGFIEKTKQQMFGKIISGCFDKRKKKATFAKYGIINVKSGGI